MQATLSSAGRIGAPNLAQEGIVTLLIDVADLAISALAAHVITPCLM